MLDAIGATPMVPVWMRFRGRRHRVFLKLEGQSLTGSIKDRTALSLVRRLEQRGHLGPGSTLVESTSGNLGVAMALICRARGYRFVAVVDPRASAENLAKLTALGAEIDMVPELADSGNYLGARLERVAELRRTRPGLVWANQYGNEGNPLAHATTTAPEILRQMGAELDAVFVAVSTCGTLAGVGSYLRHASPRTRIVAVDAQGSVVFGGVPAPRLLVGIGAGRSPDFAIEGLYDDVVHVDDATAFATCRAVEEGSGLRVGGSSGAVVAACLRYLGEEPGLDRVVCICPDTGDNYTSTIWNDAWLQAQGVDLAGARHRLDVDFGRDHDDQPLVALATR
jgi:2,3-diaminopropionate biosynthesis protein SbnA